VIHRDLKPENLLLDRHKVVKIIDFGFGNTYKPNALLETFCGSPFYAAPEMILGKRYEGPEVDMWSLGVILFALLCGHLPFDDDNMKELYKKISSGTYSIPEYVSPESQHLIKRMMTVDPKKRATLEEIKNSPWVCDGYGGPPNNYLPERPLLTRDALKPSILHRMIAFGFTPDLVKEAFDEMHKHLKALSLKEEVKPEEGDALEPASGDVVVKRNILNPTVATYFLLSGTTIFILLRYFFGKFIILYYCLQKC
jgi:serine/threonine protein kinase